MVRCAASLLGSVRGVLRQLAGCWCQHCWLAPGREACVFKNLIDEMGLRQSDCIALFLDLDAQVIVNLPFVRDVVPLIFDVLG